MIDRAGRGKVVADGVPAACGLAWDERLTDYHFGPGHPMAPLRVEPTMRLAHEFGLWGLARRDRGRPDPAAGADLQMVNDVPGADRAGAWP